MSNINLDPYLFFQGNAREAMEFYKSIFGGQLTIQTIGEGPDFPGKDKFTGDEVMHAMLDGAVRLMGSDSPKASAKTRTGMASGEMNFNLCAFGFSRMPSSISLNSKLPRTIKNDTP